MEKKEGTFSFLYKQAKDKRKNLVFSVITAFLSTISEIVPYIFVAMMISMLIAGKTDLWAYGRLSIYAILFYALKIVFHSISTNTSHKATFQILANLRKECTDKLSRMPLGEVKRRPTGSLKSVIVERIDSIETTLAHVVPEFTSNLLPPIVIIIFIFILDWRMGFASLITLAIGFLCMMGMYIGYEKYFKRTIDTTKRLNDTSVEYINGIEVIKAFSKTESSYKKFKDAALDCADSYVRWMRKSNLWFTAALVIMPATMLSILPIGSLLYMNNLINLTDLIIVILFSIALIDPFIRIASYEDDLRQIDVIVGEVLDILNSKELIRPNELSKENVILDSSITLKDVHFSYQADEEVLHGINLNIKDKDYVALVGPSGSGKSTIAKLISSMWDVDMGSISVGGVNIKDIPLKDYMNMVAYVSQDIYLFNQSIMDNLRLGARGDISDAEIINICKESGVHDFIMSLENGYKTIVGSGGGHLSGGERQRLSIARAMIKNSPIIILDEATSYADPENEAIIQESVSKLIKDKTLIVIAHRLSTVKDANRIVLVNNGNIDAIGTHDELYNSSPLYKKMWDSHISVRDRGEEDHA